MSAWYIIPLLYFCLIAILIVGNSAFFLIFVSHTEVIMPQCLCLNGHICRNELIKGGYQKHYIADSSNIVDKFKLLLDAIGHLRAFTPSLSLF